MDVTFIIEYGNAVYMHDFFSSKLFFYDVYQNEFFITSNLISQQMEPPLQEPFRVDSTMRCNGNVMENSLFSKKKWLL